MYSLHVVKEDPYLLAIDLFSGGLPPENIWGYNDDYINIKQLIIEIGKLVLKEEAKANELTKDDNYHSDYHLDMAAKEEASTSFSYRQLTYKSLLYTIHSIFESRIIELCGIIDLYRKDTGNSPLLLPKFGTRDFRKYQNYIEKRLGVSIDDLFGDKSNYREVRNSLYHRNSISDNEKAKNWIDERNKNVASNKRDVVYTTESENTYLVEIRSSAFLLDYLGKIQTVLQELESKARKL